MSTPVLSNSLEFGLNHGNCTSSSSGGRTCPSAGKVFLLESQLSTLRQQMSVLVVEMGLTHQWIRDKFGVQIVNMDSPNYKSGHGREPCFEMQSIQKSLEVTLKEAPATRTSNNAEELVADNVIISCGDKDRRTRKKGSKPSSNTATKGRQVGAASHGQSTAPAKGKAVRVTPTPSQTSSSASTPTSTNTSGVIGQSDPREKRFQCRHCSQSFRAQSNRRVHERIHTGVKPYKCRFCNDSFNQTNNRLRHEHHHTGEKAYKCGHGDCSAAFIRSGDKDRHEQTHTGQKPYSCEYCGKQFARAYGLDNHIRTHTGEKPFKCEQLTCAGAFYSAEALRIHKLRRHSLSGPN